MQPHTIHLLQMAAFLGSSFDFSTLALLMDKPDVNLEVSLSRLIAWRLRTNIKNESLNFKKPFGRSYSFIPKREDLDSFMVTLASAESQKSHSHLSSS